MACFFALLALSVAAAALTFYFFERPFLKLKDEPISWRSLGVIFRR